MDTILKDHDLITIAGNRKLYVIKSFVYNDDGYAYCQDVTEIDSKPNEYIMVKEVIVDDSAENEILTEKEEIDKLLPILKTFID